eukprot:CAMPEP_0168749708 /NCGR_PEP_ID=MMETSP0724-20121128/16861_1 /TAXON_ID=265536 /ORGANISM="Amphiprora sp., Strain CCMP467" /LENGTH=169 /DNA_ID=CAMNT_0008797637 /DNA_START=45 /DNA_END=554 /DNA_ORIENTATION=-
MKIVAALVATAATASAFSPAAQGARSSTDLGMSFELDYGKNNGYVPASAGDGGQGQFGAVSPNNWRVPGTSPIGQASYPGAADGGDEPWFSEAVSTVSLDLAKAEETLKAFTKEAAEFKMEAFSSANDIKDSDAAMADLIGAMGYDAFLEASPKQLAKQWAKLNEKKSE